jgi:hypothetical protein
MEAQAIGEAPFPLQGEGDGKVEEVRHDAEKVWINDGQYFGNVPAASWSLQVGGYQVADKWLKDRRGRKLSFDEVKHYQRILKVLSETIRIMSTIEMSLN